MKVIAIFAVVVCAAFFLSGSAAVPVAEAFAEEELLQLEPFELEEPQALVRQKRATCDLLSGTGISHSACAAHCILQHRRGGYCNSQAVCVCR